MNGSPFFQRMLVTTELEVARAEYAEAPSGAKAEIEALARLMEAKAALLNFFTSLSRTVANDN